MNNQKDKPLAFTIDEKSNDQYYIILLDGKEFCKVNKKNDIETVKKHFMIQDNH